MTVTHIPCKPVLYFRNALAGTAITASATAAGYSAASLSDPESKAPWRGIGTADHVLSGTFSAAERVGALYLGRHNLSAGSARLELFTNADYTGSVFDLTREINPPIVDRDGDDVGTWGDLMMSWDGRLLDPMYRPDKLLWFFDGWPSILSWRLTLSALVDVPQIDNLWFGPDVGLLYPDGPIGKVIDYGVIDDSDSERSLSGQLLVDARPRYERLGLNWDYMTEYDEHLFRGALLRHGKRTPLLITLRAGRDATVWDEMAQLGRVTEIRGQQKYENPGFFKLSLTIESIEAVL